MRVSYGHAAMSDDDGKRGTEPLGFWASLSKEPPREGDKLKAVFFGIGMALLMVLVSWLMFHQNSQPIQ